MGLRITILFLLPALGFAQLSAKVDSLYKLLNSENHMEASNVGYDGRESGIYRMYAELDSIANDDEAYYMAEQGNKVVKGYMSNALVNRKSKRLADLFAKYIFNDEEVHIHTGCMGYESTIAGELYGYVFYQNSKIENIRYNKENYTARELKDYNLEQETKWIKPEIDSLLAIFNKISLTNDNSLALTLNHIFRLNHFRFENYERVQYFAYKYETSEIMATLASFQNKKDLPLFHKDIDRSLLAISMFPDKSFENIISNKFENGIRNTEYYEALSAFCSDNFNKLKEKLYDTLEKTDDIMDGEYISRFQNALQNHKCDYNILLYNQTTQTGNR